jgi:hypothetical protein
MMVVLVRILLTMYIYLLFVYNKSGAKVDNEVTCHHVRIDVFHFISPINNLSSSLPIPSQQSQSRMKAS